MSRHVFLTNADPTDDLSQLDHVEVRQHLLGEARQIAAGRSRMLPTRAHLAAVIMELDETEGLAPKIATDAAEDFPASLPAGYRRPMSCAMVDGEPITVAEIEQLVDDPREIAVRIIQGERFARAMRSHLESLEERVSGLCAREVV